MNDADFEYLAFGPDAGDAVTSLVVMLHGYGRNAHYMEKMAHAVRDVVPGAMVLCLHGPEIVDHDDPGDDGLAMQVPGEVAAGTDGQSPDMLRQWFSIRGDKSLLIPRLESVGQKINRFIDTQRDILGLADRNIVLMGFSQGGGTALYTAFARATELGGLVCHSSIVLERPGLETTLKSRPPTLFLYGTADPEFSAEFFKRSFNWVQTYTSNKATLKIIDGLGHYTNTASRKDCAEFIRGVLVP